MILFFLKKVHRGLWDNLMLILLINLTFLIPLGLSFLVAPFLFGLNEGLGSGVFLFGVLLLFVWLSAAHKVAAHLVSFTQIRLKDFFKGLVPGLPQALVLLGLAAFTALVAWSSFRFYGRMESSWAIAALALVYVFLLFLFMVWMLQPAMALQKGMGLGLSFRKIGFFILRTLPIISLGLVLLVAEALVSGFLLFMIPGPLGLLLIAHETFRLAERREEFMRNNPEVSVWKIPWKELNKADQEQMGRLKNPLSYFKFS